MSSPKHETGLVNTIKATQMLNCSFSELKGLVRQGRLKRTLVDGEWYYDRHELETVERSGEDWADDHRDMLLDQASKFLAALVKPAVTLTEALGRENQAMRARIERLEALQVELVTAREKALSDQVERDLMIAAEQHREKRKDAAASQALQLLPALLGQSQASKLIQSLTSEQLAVLLEGDFTTPEQKQLIKAMASPRSKPNGAPPNGAKSQESES